MSTDEKQQRLLRRLMIFPEIRAKLEFKSNTQTLILILMNITIFEGNKNANNNTSIYEVHRM